MARFNGINIADEIKSRCNIVDVVGRVVPLKRAGSNYKGVCPFHNEKTPSFVVSDQKQIFTCFGCHASGDLFTFVQRYYNLEFMEAAEMLAKEYGIELPKNTGGGGNNKEKELFYKMNKEAAIYFYKEMRNKPNRGYPYMRRRGLSDETLHDFGIGYADESWTGLTDHMLKLGFDKDKLVEAGLVSRSDKGRYYDKFRDRIMFPIKDTSNRVIGFGGRIIGEGEPKYLNSPENIVFHKKNNLYGFNLSRKYVTEEDEIILVEGYMDVISLYQAGVKNVSASLGTALTENQARLIKRYTKNVVLSYDADNAGQQAAMRGVDILYAEDCRVRVLKVNDGKDPDEFIKNHGRKAFAELVRNALPFGDFKINFVRQKYDIRDEQQRLDFLRDAVAILREMKPIEADLYITKLAKETGISEEAIRREYSRKGAGPGGPSKPPRTAADETEKLPDEPISEAEQGLVKLMLMEHKFTLLPDDVKKCAFRNSAIQSIYQAILEVDNGDRPVDINGVKDRLEQPAVALLDSISEIIIPGDKEDVIYHDYIEYIRKLELKRELKQILTMLDMADSETDPEQITNLMNRQMEIQKILKG